MNLVVVHHWEDGNPDVANKIAAALEMLVFDVRQRLTVGSPVVMKSYADPQRAASATEQLNRDGVPTLLISPEEFRTKHPPQHVRRFRLTETALQFELADGRKGQCSYPDIRLILFGTAQVEQSEITEVETRRKFSLGRTIAAGGVPVTKKVTKKITVNNSERDEVLCLHAPGKRMLLLYRGSLDYTGLGDAVRLSRSLNFTYFKSELIRRAPNASVDGRLLQRASQGRLLGPLFDPDQNLDLACAVLALTLPR